MSDRGLSLMFVAPVGATLPIVPLGTPVEVRGVQRDGVITLTRLRSDEDGGGSGGGGDGDGGGDGGH